MSNLIGFHLPFWKDRLLASGVHLGISLAIALMAAALVFGLWYPYPYREISGGRELFLLVVTVDVILGPLITLAVFNRAKPMAELRRDLIMVAVLQLVALSYGLWTVSVARPVHLVFEFDRFRVVHAIEVPPELLDKTPPGIDALPLTGPTLLSLRPFRDDKEKSDSALNEIQGNLLAVRPDMWQPYSKAVPNILKVARPVSMLKTRFPNRAHEIDGVLEAAGRLTQDVVYLPLVGRSLYWTLFLDPGTAQVVGAIPIDPF